MATIEELEGEVDRRRREYLDALGQATGPTPQQTWNRDANAAGGDLLSIIAGQWLAVSRAKALYDEALDRLQAARDVLQRQLADEAQARADALQGSLKEGDVGDCRLHRRRSARPRHRAREARHPPRA